MFEAVIKPRPAGSGKDTLSDDDDCMSVCLSVAMHCVCEACTKTTKPTKWTMVGRWKSITDAVLWHHHIADGDLILKLLYKIEIVILAMTYLSEKWHDFD